MIEVRYISEITTLSALHTGKNVIVDGCLKDTDWYKKFFSHIREEFKNYRIAILRVGAPIDQIYERVEVSTFLSQTDRRHFNSFFFHLKFYYFFPVY